MIEFFCEEGVVAPKLHIETIRAWLTDTALTHGRTVGRLCYKFCDDEAILIANRQFLQHDYYTDIITFDESRGQRISGDMLISLDTVASNAEVIGVSFAEELHRVLIHGVLHLCGYGDKSEEEEKLMRHLEDEALSKLRALLNQQEWLQD